MAHRLFLLILFACWHFTGAYAQEAKLPGEWYVTFNHSNRQFRGEGCRISIEKKEGHFIITHLKECCPDCLPPEGAYTADNDGNLVNGDLSLSMKKGKLYYEQGGNTELSSMKSFYEADIYFTLGYKFIGKADSVKEKPKEKALLKKSIEYTDKALAINDKCVECYYNRAVAWLHMDKMDSAVVALDKAKELDPIYPELIIGYKAVARGYNKEAWDKYGKNKKYKEAITEIKKALSYDDTNVDIWYNLGGACYSDKQYADAVAAFKKTLEMDPENKNAQRGLDAAEEELNK
jgi:tetratricopeptide (TPR) repeat protein